MVHVSILFKNFIKQYHQFSYSKKEYDGRHAAIWSIGVLLYTMIEGHVPFQRPKDIVRAKLKFARLANLSLPLIDSIQWCMAIEPERRPTIDEFLKHPWITDWTD